MNDDEGNARGERVAKAIARAGVCSRREAEARIAAGRVAVNGRTLDGPAVLVTPGDVVTVDGEPLPERMPTRLWRYHKPAGLVTTHKDPQDRPTVFSALPPEMPRVVSVGRLDLNSEGLLLLTNDGAVARWLELPANAWLRRYRVRVHGAPTEELLIRLQNGMTVDGVRYGPVKAEISRQQGANAWLEVSLSEGRNREIRRLMEALGLSVTRLIRVSYGPFALGDLAPGAVAEIPPKVLRSTLGAGAGADLPKRAPAVRRPGAGGVPSAEPPARAPKPRPHRFDPSESGRRRQPPAGKTRGRPS